MADETTNELKYFNVKNTTDARLVYLGAQRFLPGEVWPVLDDSEGINRATVKADLFLEATDEEANQVETVKIEEPAKTAKPAKQTASGKGWNAQ